MYLSKYSDWLTLRQRPNMLYFLAPLRSVQPTATGAPSPTLYHTIPYHFSSVRSRGLIMSPHPPGRRESISRPTTFSSVQFSWFFGPVDTREACFGPYVVAAAYAAAVDSARYTGMRWLICTCRRRGYMCLAPGPWVEQVACTFQRPLLPLRGALAVAERRVSLVYLVACKSCLGMKR